MRIRDKYTNALGELIARLTAARISAPGKPIAFQVPHFDFIVSVLDSAVDFQSAIPEADRRGLIHQGLVATGRETKPDPQLLKDHLKRCEVEYLRKPLLDYVLASSFGIANYPGPQRILISGTAISLHKSLPIRFDRSTIREQVEELVPVQPTNIIQVLARVSARTPFAAFEQAQRSTELLRGLWTTL